METGSEQKRSQLPGTPFSFFSPPLPHNVHCFLFVCSLLYPAGWMMPVDELQERADIGNECKKAVGALLLSVRGEPVPRVPAPSDE